MGERMMQPSWAVHALGAGAVAVLTGVFWFGAVAPYTQGSTARAESEAALLSEQGEAVRLTRTAARLETQLREAETDASQGGVTLRRADRINPLIADLIELGGAHRVRFDAVEPGGASVGEMFEYVQLALRGRGTFGDCQAMLASLHTEHPDVKVVGLRLESAGGGAGTSTPMFALDLVWFAAPGE